MDLYDKALEAKEYIEERINVKPKVGMILGSGLGGIKDIVNDPVTIEYKDIPHFPVSTVKGHSSNLIIGGIGANECIIMNGRFHYYEGFTMKEITFPLYVMKLLGVESLIITNACGAINEGFEVGDIMFMNDFINIIGVNPLIGENDERFGPRFPDMTEPFDKGLLDKAIEISKNLGISYKEGSYAYFNGPCYETKAEIRAFKIIGADTIGMSTVPEITVSNYLGMKNLGICCITNMATGIQKVKHSHDRVLKAAMETGENVAKLIIELLKNEI